MKCSAVTGLYDIGRRSADGRPIDRYVAWLNETLRLPIPFTIFLDPAIPDGAVRPKEGDVIVRKPFGELAAARWLAEVESICARLASNPDLTFQLPAYGIVLHSKFEWLEEAHSMRPDDSGLLWVDAGISRFFGEPGRLRYVNQKLLERMSAASKPAFVDGRRDVARMQRRGETTAAGTSRPITHAGTFFVKASFAGQLRADVFARVERWLGQGLWDNEQVVMGEMFLEGYPGLAMRRQTGIMGAFARAVFPDADLVHRLREQLIQVGEDLRHK